MTKLLKEREEHLFLFLVVFPLIRPIERYINRILLICFKEREEEFIEKFS
jgi:hypothetical protein